MYTGARSDVQNSYMLVFLFFILFFFGPWGFLRVGNSKEKVKVSIL